MVFDTAKSFTRSALQVSGIAEAGLHRHCFFSCPAGCLIQQFLDLNISKPMAELIDPHALTLDLGEVNVFNWQRCFHS